MDFQEAAEPSLEVWPRSFFPEGVELVPEVEQRESCNCPEKQN
jgi:hypothetical protein